MKWLRAFGLLGIAVLLTMPAQAQKSADTLRVAWRDRVNDPDPYFAASRTGLVLAHQVWDTLIFRDPATGIFKPLLATGWRWVDDTTLEFPLRPNVKFHNGDAFTAADVVYTVATSGPFEWLAGSLAIDPLTVQLKLKRPMPAALEYIAATLPILPQTYRSRVGRAGFSAAPIGTGPYRIASFTSGKIELERFAGYFDGGAKGSARIGRITITQLADATAELDALLNNRADWIWQFNPELYDPIARESLVTAQRQEAPRIAQLTLNPAPGTPLADLRVRQAIMHAINRQAFIRQFTHNPAKIPDAPCVPAQFGCDTAAAVRWDYAPEKARALLAAAGFGKGFDTDIISTGVAPSWATAIQSDLAATGIRARITVLSPTEALPSAGMLLSAFGAGGIYDVSAILPTYFGGGAADLAHDKTLITLLDKAATQMDPAARKLTYASAIHMMTEQAYVLPLSSLLTLYGVSRTLEVKPTADEMPRFFWMKWK